MKRLNRIMGFIDKVTDLQGKAVCFIAIPMVIALVYEVIARYIFGAPTPWSYDVTYMIYGTHFLLGASFALLYKVHIRIDVFYSLFPKKAQNVIDVLGYLLFFFPVVTILTFSGLSMAYDSYKIKEVSQFSPWAPLLWPFKTVIAVAFVFLFLQGIAEFLRALVTLVKGDGVGENQ